MTSKKTWFITGAGRGMGVDFAKAALAAGHHVVATGRNPDAVAQALGRRSSGRQARRHQPRGRRSCG
jgi:NAD(P)-dependent dehydrogenase (short-subunit alcohol dehydrogenase family)